MVKLWFPKDDKRSSGKPLIKRRPWLFHGAVGRIVDNSKRHTRMHTNTAAVQFNGAPKGNYDLVSYEFLRVSGRN